MKIYRVMMNVTAADVVANNDKLFSNYATQRDAVEVAIALQRQGLATAAWVEEVKRPRKRATSR